MSKHVCALPKNSREDFRFSLGDYKGHRFIDMRVYAIEEGKDPAPTKKGLAVSPAMWAQFRAALAQLEEAMVQQGWLTHEDLAQEG